MAMTAMDAEGHLPMDAKGGRAWSGLSLGPVQAAASHAASA